MRCHYCEGDADVVTESGGIRVGLCDVHFRERIDELADEEFAELKERLDVERD
jgi:hypothetical protein